jgi:cytochrome oxidase Cu insertion factor (SCO1/SenC/PrrC family)
MGSAEAGGRQPEKTVVPPETPAQGLITLFSVNSVRRVWQRGPIELDWTPEFGETMQPSRRAAHIGILSAVVVFAGSLSLIWARHAALPAAVAELEQPAPAFALSGTDGAVFDSADRLPGRVSVLCFTSAQCPTSNRYKSRILELARRYGNDGVKFVAIHPTATSPTAMELDEIRVQDRVTGQRFPTLIDSGGHVAAAYGASETPLFVVLDREGRVRYRGSFDDNPDTSLVSQHYVANAVRALLEPQVSEIAFTQAGGSLLR